MEDWKRNRFEPDQSSCVLLRVMGKEGQSVVNRGHRGDAEKHVAVVVKLCEKVVHRCYIAVLCWKLEIC